ncbi:MAG: flagellar biosynthesis anti-sigma factor FlgM [Leptothrix sp. (in: b-proteobacteria)]|jgi:negative regulator of flagellin synthesis FlgM
MKIGNTAGAPGISPLANASAPPPDGTDSARVSKGRPGAASPSNSSTTVQLSSTATDLLGQTVDGTFDQTKVEQVKQSIADGSYKVNAEAVADKLIANAQELLGRVASSQR